MAIIHLVTYDGFEVHLTDVDVWQYFNNGVFPRLLGLNAEDGLTTPEPSRDSDGRLTILMKLGISRRAFLGLLRLLRCGASRSSFDRRDWDDIINASLSMGGIEAVDEVVRHACADEAADEGSDDETGR